MAGLLAGWLTAAWLAGWLAGAWLAGWLGGLADWQARRLAGWLLAKMIDDLLIFASVDLLAGQLHGQQGWLAHLRGWHRHKQIGRAGGSQSFYFLSFSVISQSPISNLQK